jgi:hypothetical protein
MSAEAPTPAAFNTGGGPGSGGPYPGQHPHRRPRRRRGPIVAAVAAGVLAVIAVVSGLAYAVTGSAWKAEYAKFADEVATGYELTQRSASGNVMCFDVCRELTSHYLTQEPAEVVIEKVAARMRSAGFTDIGHDCEENVWCSAWGDAGEVAVYVSKYKDASWAAEKPDLGNQVTVTVSMPE